MLIWFLVCKIGALMHKTLKLIAILLVFTVAAVMFIIKDNDAFTAAQGGIMDKKVLVAYFSWSGNTKSVAEKIQSQTGGDIFEIIPQKPYPTDYHDTTVIAKQEKENNVKPPLKNNIDVSGYDVIFVGTPAWWYTMAPPVMTFLEENNFSGKTVVPFVTHGGGGGYTIDKDMAALAKGAKVLSPFVVYGRGGATVNADITKWIDGLSF